jgi:macrolide-specific efflux system membrane fusion protein
MSKIFRFFKNFFKNRFREAIIFAVIIGLIIVAVRVVKSKNQQPQIQTQKVERGTIISSISASGQILTANIVNITTNTKGLVKKVYVKDGDKVTAGQKIMEISLDSDVQQKASAAYASYLSAKNNLDSAQATLYSLQSQEFAANQKFINDAVARSLKTDDPTYIQQYADWLAAEAKYKNQQNVITQSQVAINSAWLAYQSVSPIITAPISGTITNLTHSEGMTLSASADVSQRIAVIESEGTPMATFNISEIDVSKVRSGQKATIKLDSLSDKTFTGKVMAVDKIGTITSGVTNYPVVIKFDSGASEILPNMSATANIILEVKDNVLLVPSSAIQKQNDQNVVKVMKGKQQQAVNVEVGLSSDTQTEIISGLSEGDEIITSTSSTSSNQSGGSVFSGGGAGRMFMGR